MESYLILGVLKLCLSYNDDPSKENGQLKRKKKDKGCQRIP
jgi:hypothetical protein